MATWYEARSYGWSGERMRVGSIDTLRDALAEARDLLRDDEDANEAVVLDHADALDPECARGWCKALLRARVTRQSEWVEHPRAGVRKRRFARPLRPRDRRPLRG